MSWQGPYGGGLVFLHYFESFQTRLRLPNQKRLGQRNPGKFMIRILITVTLYYLIIQWVVLSCFDFFFDTTLPADRATHVII
jgi:hypothetical protein